MTQPKIFVSSTILDFEDLRSALKYYLSEFKYDVQMSEYPNFNVSADKSTFDACIKNLETCDYFILLIGYRRGNWYKNNKISITHHEYRKAKELIESGHPLRIISFIRKPLYILRNEQKEFIEHVKMIDEKLKINIPSSIIDDPEYIYKFIDEVSQGIIFPGSDSPSNNWIYDFTTFEDILVALKHTFHIDESLTEKKIKSLFIYELKQNKKKFEIIHHKTKLDDYKNILDIPKVNLFHVVAENYSKYVVNERGFIKTPPDSNMFPGEELVWLFNYVLLEPMNKNLRNLQTRILQRVVDDGLYLQYNVDSASFSHDYFSTVLEKLFEMIRNYVTWYDSPIYSDFSKDFSRIMTDGSGRLETFPLPTNIAAAIIIQSKAARIYDLIVCILDFLENGNTQEILDFDFSLDYIKKYAITESE